MKKKGEKKKGKRRGENGAKTEKNKEKKLRMIIVFTN